MNWKELNEKYPLAFLEYMRFEDIVDNETSTINFTETDTDNFTYFFSTDTGEGFCIDGEEVYKIPHYFDGSGIYVDPFWNNALEKFICDVCTKENGVLLLKDNYPDRLAALKAGIEKAFEIRQEQLLKLKQ